MASGHISIHAMNKRLFLAAATAVAILGSNAQINSPASDGYLARAVKMYDNENYIGCLDQLTMIDPASLTEPDAVLASFYRAAATVHTDKAYAATLLSEFLMRNQSSALRDAALLAYGDCYYGSDYARALEIYSSVNPRGLTASLADDLLFRQGYSNLKLGQYADATQCFQKLASSREYAGAAEFYNGYIAYCNGDYALAERILSGVDTSAAPGSMADFYLSQIYYQRGEFKKALSTARSILDRHNIDDEFIAEAYRIAGESEFELGNDAKAVELLSSYMAMTEAPMPSTLYILGLDSYNNGEYDKAAEYMQPVTLGNDAMAQSAYLYLGLACLRLDDYTAAAMAFNRALSMSYDLDVQETAYYNYAVASLQGGKVPFANTVTIFSDFLRKYPGSRYAPDVQEYIIASYLTDNNYDAALESINSMRNPSKATLAAKQRVLYALGNRALAEGSYPRALEYLTEASQLGSGDRTIDNEVALSFGEALYRNGKYEQAQAQIQNYLKRSSSSAENYPVALYDMGYTLYTQKKYDDAITYFSKMLASPGYLGTNVKADAYNRLGDCQLNLKQYEKAELAYGHAYDIAPHSGDYSLFQKALIQGYQRNHRQKIETMQIMQKRFPSSALIPDAMLETTESYLQLGESANALKTYRELVNKYPNTAQGRQGYLQMALTMLNTGDRPGAIKAYKDVISRYPSSDEAAQAIEQMKRIASEDGNLRDFMAFVNSVEGAPSIDESEVEQISFETAEKAYLTRSDISKLEDFADEYPDSKLRPRALAYLIEGFIDKGDTRGAYDYACALVRQYPDNTLSQQALIEKAKIEEAEGKGNLALDTWQQLASIASSPQLLLQARMGILRNAREAGDNALVIKTADAVTSTAGVGDGDLTEARFSRGLALLRKGDTKNARKELETIASNTSNLYGLQSAYYLGESYFDAKDYTNAERWAQSVANADTQHQYWQARGFILLSDVYAANGDKFKARQYLEAVRDYYKGTEKDIFDMINQRLR